MATIRITTDSGPVALVPSAITTITQEGDAVWLQDIHGDWWQALDRSFEDIATELDFILRKTQ